MCYVCELPYIERLEFPVEKTYLCLGENKCNLYKKYGKWM